MQVTSELVKLIESLERDDINSAKSSLIAYLKKNTTKKNQKFFDQSIDTLKRSIPLYEGIIPDHLKDFISVIDTSCDREMDYYLLTEDLEKLSRKIKMMNRAASKMTSMQIRYLNSVLLYGESGTGKTLFARYIARMLGLPFIYVNISQIIDSHLGVTSKNISRVFDFVRGADCVIMIDEIDGISNNRNESSSNGPDSEISRITLTIMKEMDSLRNETVLLAATNCYDRIDDALKRRFTVKHRFSRLSDSDKRVLVSRFFDYACLDFDSETIREIAEKSDTQADLMLNCKYHLAEMLISHDENDCSSSPCDDTEVNHVSQDTATDTEQSSETVRVASWVKDSNGMYRCSSCLSPAKIIPLTKYCPDCGTQLTD